MKRFVIAALLSTAGFSALFASPAYSLHLGMDFFNYDSRFLDIGVAVTNEFQSDTEFSAQLNFAITTAEIAGVVRPSFYVPLDLGLNFLFPSSGRLGFLFGAGFATVFHSAPETPSAFYLGPYMKGGVRVAVHEQMKLFLEFQQDLLIGGPRWVNTSSRLVTGITFNFAATKTR